MADTTPTLREAAQQAHPGEMPATAEDIRAFVGHNFAGLRYGSEDQQPCDDDLYSVTAHDLLSSFFEWFEGSPPEERAEPVPLPDARIDAIADLVLKGMPGGALGFCKEWGYRQFARALLEDCRGYYRAALAEQAAEQAEPVAVPAGYALVPVEPTEAMVKAGEAAHRNKERDMQSPTPTEFPWELGGPMGYAWAAMIAAAPPAPARQEPPADWSVFNTGAEVAGGLTYAEALDYLTPARLERGWSAVCVVNKDNITAATSEGGAA